MYKSTRAGSDPAFSARIAAIVLTVFAVLAAISVAGGSDTSDAAPSTYEIADGVLTISGTGPMNVSGLPATGYTSVIIAEGITSVQEGIFWSNTSIESVVLADSVVSIGDMAFYECSSLASLDLGSVQTIGDNAFGFCDKLTSLTIPDTCTLIGKNAFDRCTSIETLDLGNGIERVGNSAFMYCTSLESLTIPASLTSVGDYAFHHLDSVTTLVVPSTLEEFGDEAFSYGGFTTVTLYEGMAPSEGMFEGCASLGSVEIPSGVTAIPSCMFCWCTSLEDISIPASVTSIGFRAFSGCAMEQILLPNDLSVIDNLVFEECTSLTRIFIPGGVEEIGGQAFTGCSSLEEIEFGNGVATIGKYSFEDCVGIKCIIFPESVSVIDETSFVGCRFFDAAGVTELFKCDELRGHMFHGADRSRLIMAENHTRGETQDTVIRAPTCTEGGLTAPAVKCTVCGMVLSSGQPTPVPPTGHTEVTDKGSAPTCVAPGLTEGSHCSVCETVLKSQTLIPETGIHTPAEAVRENVVEATCASEGSYESVVYCSVCENELSRRNVTIPQLPSSSVEDTREGYNVDISDEAPYISASDLNDIVNSAKNDPAKILVVTSGNASIRLDNGALKCLDTEKDAEVKISQEESIIVPGTTGQSTVYEISIGDNHDFNGGKLTISLPYTGPVEDLKVYHFRNGSVAETLPCTFEDGMVTFEVGSLSIFAIANAKSSEGNNGGSCSMVVFCTMLALFAVAVIPVVRYVRI